MKSKLNKGFTLIELLVVIAIIGILAGIVLVGLSLARERARDARVKEELGNLRAAMELYYNDHKAYQDDSEGTNACASAGASTILADLNSFTTGACSDSLSAGAGWVAAVHLPSDSRSNIFDPDAEWWCLDSKGANVQMTIQDYSTAGGEYCP